MKKVTKIILAILAAFVLLLAIAFGVAWKVYLNPRVVAKDTIPLTTSAMASSEEYQNVKYIAHRGASASAPENTLPAITLAGERGYYGAEFDIYYTADGKWVIMHDPFLFRMTDGFWQISKYTYEELLQFTYDNGANYENYPNLKITLLTDALDECKKYNMVPCVEIKSADTEHLDELAKLLQDYGFGDCPILSFKFEQVEAMRKYGQDFRIWYLVREITQEDIDKTKALGGVCGIDFQGTKEKNTAQSVKLIKDAGLEAVAWTIDDVETLERMLSYGVDYITTNTILPQ